MAPNPESPLHPLQTSKDERIESFTQLFINHEFQDEIFNRMRQSLGVEKPGQIFVIGGPSRVGKTALLRELQKTLILDYFHKMNTSNELPPVISFETTLPFIKDNYWKEFYLRILQLLNRFPQKYTSMKFQPKEALIDSGVRTILVDESQHLENIKGEKEREKLKDLILSIKEHTKCNFVFFGESNVLGLHELLEAEFIFYPPYYAFPHEFETVVKTFETKLPLKEKPDLMKHFELIYEKTDGFVGVLKSWLDKSLIEAIRDEKETEFEEIFLKHAPQMLKHS